MKTSRRRILLALTALAPATGGCVHVHHRQEFVKERSGTPIRAHAGDGVRVRAPFVDVRVPARKALPAAPAEGPAFDPE